MTSPDHWLSLSALAQVLLGRGTIMTSPGHWLLLSAFAQVLLVFVIYGVLYQRRIPRVMADEIKVRDVALDKDKWPVDAQLAANSLGNQFEVPVLLFVAVGTGLYLGIGWLEASLAWLFVATRWVHAFIHVTTNHVIHRFFAFASGVVILGILWLDLLIRLIGTMIASS